MTRDAFPPLRDLGWFFAAALGELLLGVLIVNGVNASACVARLIGG